MAFSASLARQAFTVATGRLGIARPGVGRRALLEIATLLAFCGAILATNYALTGLPNVKLFDLLVFVAGYTLGFRRGAAVAALSWTVYGTFNPWGPTTPGLLATVTLSEVAYAAAGALCHRWLPLEKSPVRPGLHTLALAALALASTLAYDAATNVYTGITWAQLAGSADYGRWIAVALFNPGALWFSGMHIGSNVAAFSLLAPAMIVGTRKVQEFLRW